MRQTRHRIIVAAVMALPLLLGLAPGAQAQSAAGIRGGMRSAELVAPQPTERVEHLVVGGYYGVGLADRVALQLELVYGYRGGAGLRVGRDGLDAAEPPARVRMQYLDLPVLLRAGFPGQRLLASLFLGPYAGFMLGCELEIDGERRRCQADEDQRFSPRATDFGIVAGGGLDLAFGESTLFVDLRHSRGLLSIQTAADPMDARHSAIDITAGFAFPLGR